MDVKEASALLEEMRDFLGETRWSGKVKTKWHPPEGFFKQSAGDIASGLKKASKDLSQAVSRLNFYKNRAGKNLPVKERANLDSALKKLQGMHEECGCVFEGTWGKAKPGEVAMRKLVNALSMRRRKAFMHRGNKLLSMSMNEIATVEPKGKTFDIVINKTGEKHSGVSEDRAVEILTVAIDKGPR